MRPEVAARLVALDNPVLVGLIVDRFWPMRLKQKEQSTDIIVPAVTYSVVSGVGHNDIPFAYPLVQFTAWGLTQAQARAVADAVKWGIQRYKGVKGGVPFAQIVHEGDLDLYDPVTGYYAVPATYRLIHEEV